MSTLGHKYFRCVDVVTATPPPPHTHTHTVTVQAAVEHAQSEMGVVILNMDWEDTEQFTIPQSDFVQSSKFIHEGRQRGGSVLVHCAQVSE